MSTTLLTMSADNFGSGCVTDANQLRVRNQATCQPALAVRPPRSHAHSGRPGIDAAARWCPRSPGCSPGPSRAPPFPAACRSSGSNTSVFILVSESSLVIAGRVHPVLVRCSIVHLDGAGRHIQLGLGIRFVRAIARPQHRRQDQYPAPLAQSRHRLGQRCVAIVRPRTGLLWLRARPLQGATASFADPFQLVYRPPCIATPEPAKSCAGANRLVCAPPDCSVSVAHCFSLQEPLQTDHH
jgi:hypothetical protein